jgi:Glycosyl transferase family 2
MKGAVMPLPPPIPLNIAAVAIVRNEASILGTNLAHLYELGVRKYVLMDNASNDATVRIIETFRNTSTDAQVMVIHDPTLLFWQSAKITAMARLAHQTMAADWIFPFDADDFLWFPDTTMAHAIGADIDYIRLPWVHVHPGTATVDRFRAIHRDGSTLSGVEAPTRIGKVLVRWNSDLVITAGNHGVRSDRRHVLRSVDGSSLGMASAHFPVRTIEQFSRRMTQKRTLGNSGSPRSQFWTGFSGTPEQTQAMAALYEAFCAKDAPLFEERCHTAGIDPLALDILNAMVSGELVCLPHPRATVQPVIEHIVAPRASPAMEKTTGYKLRKCINRMLPYLFSSLWWRAELRRVR